jgi:predicted membrane protein
MRWDRVVMGATLIVIGVLFLLDRADVLDAGQVIGDWWPAVIVAFGLVTLAERPVSLLGPVLLVAVGVLLLLVTNDVLETSAWNVIWPAALIAFGLTVLFRNSRRGDHLVLGEGHDQDLVRTTAFLSGSELATQSNAFRGAVLTAIMGGVELDMRHATLAEDGAEVDATAIMGGVDLIIPRDWRVTVRGTPILGGVGNRAEGSSLPEDAPRLRVDALAILGGVEIKHDK